MGNLQLDIQKIQNNDRLNARIMIPNGSGTDVIKFFMTNDFSFSLGNSWEKLASLSDMPLASTFNDMFNLLVAIGSSGNSTPLPQGTLESIHMTAASWKGSQIPSFSIDCLFVASSYDESPLTPLLKLARGALPSGTYQFTNTGNTVIDGVSSATREIISTVVQVGAGIGAGIGALVKGENIMEKGAEAYNNSQELGDNIGKNIVDGSAMKAPLGYGLQGFDNTGNITQPIPNTTLQLYIGNWFKADNLLIDSISGITFSKEIIAPDPRGQQNKASGKPLYVRANLALRPYKMVTVEDFMKYFNI